MNKLNIATRFFQACFILSAVYHLVSIFVPNGVPEPIWQHVLFALVVCPIMFWTSMPVVNGNDVARMIKAFFASMFAAQQVIQHLIWISDLKMQALLQNIGAIAFAMTFAAWCANRRD